MREVKLEVTIVIDDFIKDQVSSEGVACWIEIVLRSSLNDLMLLHSVEVIK